MQKYQRFTLAATLLALFALSGCAAINPSDPGDRFNAYLIAAETNAAIHLPPAAATEVSGKLRDAKLIYAQNSAPGQ
jgi:hypothetical protein